MSEQASGGCFQAHSKGHRVAFSESLSFSGLLLSHQQNEALGEMRSWNLLSSDILSLVFTYLSPAEPDLQHHGQSLDAPRMLLISGGSPVTPY